LKGDEKSRLAWIRLLPPSPHDPIGPNDAIKVTRIEAITMPDPSRAISDLKSEAIDFRAAAELFAPYRQLTAQSWSAPRIINEQRGRKGATQ
jgi:hypothetical protein